MDIYDNGQLPKRNWHTTKELRGIVGAYLLQLINIKFDSSYASLLMSKKKKTLNFCVYLYYTSKT